MNFNLAGKTALITGGTSGIGRSVAGRFIEAGAEVWIAGRRDSGTRIADDIGARFVRADVSRETDVVEMFDEVGRHARLDILVLNAGDGTLGKPIQSTTAETCEQVNRVNLYGTFFGLKHGAAAMNDNGSIICTSSAATEYRLAGFEPYVSSKAALESLVRSAAIELGARGIRVNAVCPGGVETEMAPYDAGFDRKVGKLAAIGRAYMNVTEIVGVYHLLAAAEGGFITGQAIRVDGGLGLGCTPAVFDEL